MAGWIHLHRKLLDSKIFASEKGLKIWIWILLKSNHKKKFSRIQIGNGESTVEVDRGEFIFGRFKAEEELDINGSTVYKWINKMQDLGMISLKSNNHYTIVKVLNYDDYNTLEDEKVTADRQPSNSRVTTDEQQANNRRTTDEQQTNTTKNDKNDKNDKNEENDKKEKKSQNKNILLSAVDKNLIPESEKQFYDIAISFQAMLIEKFKSQKLSCGNIENAKYVNWINDIRLMIEIDKRSVEEIRQIWNFLKKETIGEDKFAWFINIQSMSKLRTQYEKVLNKAKISQNGTFTKKQRSANSGIQDEIRRATEQMLGVGKRTN